MLGIGGSALGAIALVLPLSGRVQATPEVWKCDFNGTWTEDGKNMGTFTWNVTWDGSDDKWTVTGTSKDSLGTANTTGTCGEKNCSIRQTYTSGELKGSIYYWSGTYVDADEIGRAHV